MDPNAALTELRELLANRDGAPEDGTYVATMDRIAELAESLDGWLSKGGFLPQAWNKQTLVWTLEGEQLRDLAGDATGARRLHVSVDWGDLKWKRNEDTWTAGIEPDKGVQ